MRDCWPHSRTSKETSMAGAKMREGEIEKHSIKEVKEGRIGGERSSLQLTVDKRVT